MAVGSSDPCRGLGSRRACPQGTSMAVLVTIILAHGRGRALGFLSVCVEEAAHTLSHSSAVTLSCYCTQPQVWEV